MEPKGAAKERFEITVLRGENSAAPTPPRGMTTTSSDPARTKGRPVKGPSSPKRPLRILLADDHQIVREGVRAIVERQGFKVVAEAANGQEAVGRTLELQPDVAVLDLAMPLKNGIQAAQEILRNVPETRIILLTVHREDYYVRQALQAGVHGYVLKSESAEDLVQAIHQVCQGMIYLSADISPQSLRDGGYWRRGTRDFAHEGQLAACFGIVPQVQDSNETEAN